MKSLMIIGTILVAILAFTGPAIAGDINVGSNNNDNTAAAAQVDNVGAEATILMDNSVPAEQAVNAKGYRGFPENTPSNFGGLISAYLKEKNYGPQCLKMEVILEIKPVWTADEIALADDTGWGDIEEMPTQFIALDLAEEDLPAEVKFQEEPCNGTLIAFYAMRALDTDVTSMDLSAKVAAWARARGANVVRGLGEGPEANLLSDGWGIGFHSTMANLSGSEKTGTVGGGGMGYSSAEAGYKDFPWLQFAIYRTVD